MKKFKGFQRESYLFDNNCSRIKITYTGKLCTKALNDLILSGSLKQVQNNYGAPVKNCFTDYDLKSFNKVKK